MLAGSAAAPNDPPNPEGAKGAASTTPAGEESNSGVANDKTDGE